jgi:hypothetical protein
MARREEAGMAYGSRRAVEEEAELVGEALDGILARLVFEVREQLQEHLLLFEEEAAEGLRRVRRREQSRLTFSSESL